MLPCFGCCRGKRSRSFDQSGQFLPHSLEHAALGEEYGVQLQVKRFRSLRGRFAFQDLAAERLPCRRVEVALHPLHQLLGDVPVVLELHGAVDLVTNPRRIPEKTGRRCLATRLLSKSCLSLGATDCLDLFGTPTRLRYDSGRTTD
jgi:hypothetical protein